MEQLTRDELSRIKGLQRLAYDCAEEVAAGLLPGVTEREAAERLGAVLRARGVQGFFHTPFAWFGDRAAFQGFVAPSLRRPLDNIAFAEQFFPTMRRLERGMPAILDVAPIRDGLCADIGYAFTLGPNPEAARARAFLLELRALILAEVRAGRSMRAIYRSVDEAIAAAGYESAHHIYPSSVLAHRVGRIPLARRRAPMIRGFDARTYLYFGSLFLDMLPRLRRSPLWNGTRLADEPPAPGLWAVEPHIRCGAFGAKWEEILVVDEAGARWLDDDLPHVRPAQGSAAA
jgi:Xaa-Pro aminopeptidase